MNQFFKRILPKGEFARNTIILTLGTTIAQLFPIVFYPILGRIFTPAEFGLLATLTTITNILVILASGKYDQSILISDSKDDAANIIGLILFISSIFLSITFILLQIFSNQVSAWLQNPELKKWLFIPPLSAFVIIIFNCFNEWCIRHKYFVTLSWNKITNAAAHTLGKLFFGFVKITGNGLIAGDLLGRTFSAGTCVYRALKKDKKKFAQISGKNFLPLSKKYIEFPKYTLPDQLLNTLGVSIPILFIGAYYNNVEVGYYSMTMQLLSLPISVISRAIRDVFRQKANEEYIEHGHCSSLFKSLLLRLSLPTIIATVAVIFFLPDLFALFLGNQWRIAGQYSQILLPMMALNFISMSLSGIFIIVRKMKISLYWQIYYVIVTTVSLLVGLFVFEDIIDTFYCFAIGRGSAYFIYLLLSYRYSKGIKQKK